MIKCGVDYNRWLELVRKAECATDGVDEAWLKQMFAADVSPAVVAKQIKSGSAPAAQPPAPDPQPVVAQVPPPVMAQPTVASPAPMASAPRFPKDGLEWSASMILSALAGFSCILMLGNMFWIIVLGWSLYPQEHTLLIEIFLKKTWIPAAFLVAVIFVQRRLMIYSPVRRWDIKRTLVTYAVILVALELFLFIGYLGLKAKSQTPEGVNLGLKEMAAD